MPNWKLLQFLMCSTIKADIVYGQLCMLQKPEYKHFGFQPKNNVRSAPASSALTKSGTEAITCLPQIITYAVVEKGMETKEN